MFSVAPQTEQVSTVTISMRHEVIITLCVLTQSGFLFWCVPGGSGLLSLLVEQASLKQSELDAHPVRSSMKQLIHSLDQLCPFEPDGDLTRPDFVRSFLDYVNTLASVLVRSLGSEGRRIC